jgi:chromosome segregation ATPase
MLTEKDLSQIQNYMIQVLPQLLYQQPEIASSIKSLITPQLPVQNESVRILEELKLLREDTHKHFQQVEHRIEQVEHRFEQVEHRLEQVEQRMEKFEERTEQNEQRMAQIERRIEQNERQIERQREEMIQRCGKDKRKNHSV